MRPKEFAARVWSKLRVFERENSLLEPGDRVLAAVSGGPDSTALAHYLSARRKPVGFELFFMHIHHGLRGADSDKDLRFAEKLGEKLGVPVSIARVETRLSARVRGQGIEDAARKLRYEALSREAARLRCNKVAAAHHLDDQAETVLLNLLRGSRLAALGAMPPRRLLAKKTELIRPFLPLTKKDIQSYLKIHRLRARTDRSNLSPEFTRNWLRLEILPALLKKQPRTREHLASIAAQARAIFPFRKGSRRRARQAPADSRCPIP